jgi:hypothetical protein
MILLSKDEEKVLAFIKYDGESVSNGYLDARKSGEALIAIDETLRYFIIQEEPSLSELEFDLPVRVRKGSWETIIPQNIDALIIKAGATWVIGKYVGSALSEMAKNDLKDVGFKSIIKKSFQGLVWVIRIAMHVGTMAKNKFDNLKFSHDNSKVLILNANGEELWVPTKHIETYINCPNTIFSKLANLIEEKRDLSIGVDDGNVDFVKINNSKKAVFVKEETEEELLFPELEHGKYVEIEGHITRGNEKTNTIGFLFKDHILTCIPVNGNVKDRKDLLFTNVILKGTVNRLDKNDSIKEKRPRIYYTKVVTIDSNNTDKQPQLF